MGLDNPIHIALLLLVVLLVFGAKRLPEMGRSLGDGLRGFKEAVNTDGSTVRHDTATESLSAATPAPVVTAERSEADERPLATVAADSHEA
jgi:sec-independent protein translocase protein TatA